MFNPWNDPFNMFEGDNRFGSNRPGSQEFRIVEVGLQYDPRFPPYQPGQYLQQRSKSAPQPFSGGNSGGVIPKDKSIIMLKFMKTWEWGWVDHESIRIDCDGRCWVNSEYYVFTEPPKQHPLQQCYGPPKPRMVAVKKDEGGWVIDIRFAGFQIIEREGEPGPFIPGKSIMDEMTGKTPGKWDEPVMRVYY